MRFTIEIPDNDFKGSQLVEMAKEQALKFRREIAIPDRSTETEGAMAGALAIIAGTIAAVFAAEDCPHHIAIMMSATNSAARAALEAIDETAEEVKLTGRTKLSA